MEKKSVLSIYFLFRRKINKASLAGLVFPLCWVTDRVLISPLVRSRSGSKFVRPLHRCDRATQTHLQLQLGLHTNDAYPHSDLHSRVRKCKTGWRSELSGWSLTHHIHIPQDSYCLPLSHSAFVGFSSYTFKHNRLFFQCFFICAVIRDSQLNNEFKREPEQVATM